MIYFTEKTQIVTYWILVIRHWSLNCQESISRNFVSEIIYWVKGIDLRCLHNNNYKSKTNK